MSEYTMDTTDSGSLKIQYRGEATVDEYCRDLKIFMKENKLTTLNWPTVYFSTPESRKNNPYPAYKKKSPAVKKLSQKQVDKMCKEFEDKGAVKKKSIISQEDIPFIM